MHLLHGNTINFKDMDACWIKKCDKASIIPDHSQGGWNVYSSLCANVYNFENEELNVQIQHKQQLDIGRELDKPINFNDPRDLADRSIFVVFATYREVRCVRTLHSMYSQAERPDLLYVGIFQQNAPEDPDCLDWSEHCPGDPM
eukprot:UN28046